MSAALSLIEPQLTGEQLLEKIDSLLLDQQNSHDNNIAAYELLKNLELRTDLEPDILSELYHRKGYICLQFTRNANSGPKECVPIIEETKKKAIGFFEESLKYNPENIFALFELTLLGETHLTEQALDKNPYLSRLYIVLIANKIKEYNKEEKYIQECKMEYKTATLSIKAQDRIIKTIADLVIMLDYTIDNDPTRKYRSPLQKVLDENEVAYNQTLSLGFNETIKMLVNGTLRTKAAFVQQNPGITLLQTVPAGGNNYIFRDAVRSLQADELRKIAENDNSKDNLPLPLNTMQKIHLTQAEKINSIDKILVSEIVSMDNFSKAKDLLTDLSAIRQDENSPEDKSHILNRAGCLYLKIARQAVDEATKNKARQHAEAFFLRALHTHPDNALAYYELALLADTNKIELSKNCYAILHHAILESDNKAPIDPQNMRVNKVELLLAAVHCDPQFSAAYFQLAKCYAEESSNLVITKTSKALPHHCVKSYQLKHIADFLALAICTRQQGPDYSMRPVKFQDVQWISAFPHNVIKQFQERMDRAGESYIPLLQGINPDQFVCRKAILAVQQQLNAHYQPPYFTDEDRNRLLKDQSSSRQ